MTTTHKPATPLPFIASVDNISRDNLLLLRGMCGNASDGVQNAAYIAHAANAYPKLVAALRRIDATISGSQAQAVQIGNAIALLRELGEGE